MTINLNNHELKKPDQMTELSLLYKFGGGIQFKPLRIKKTAIKKAHHLASFLFNPVL